MYNLKGKVALVTGAARKCGIGHATAVRLTREGVAQDWKEAHQKGIDILEVDKERHSDTVPFTPLKRLGYPEEMAAA